jgi:uncharacterized protein YuzE
MNRPINVTVDQDGATYIYYTKNPVARTVDVTEDCEVAADIDANGDTVGIEILDARSGVHVDAARAYASQHQLDFPRELRVTTPQR